MQCVEIERIKQKVFDDELKKQEPQENRQTGTSQRSGYSQAYKDSHAIMPDLESRGGRSVEGAMARSTVKGQKRTLDNCKEVQPTHAKHLNENVVEPTVDSEMLGRDGGNHSTALEEAVLIPVPDDDMQGDAMQNPEGRHTTQANVDAFFRNCKRGPASQEIVDPAQQPQKTKNTKTHHQSQHFSPIQTMPKPGSKPRRGYCKQ